MENAFAPVSYSMASIGSPTNAVLNSPFLVAPSSGNSVKSNPYLAASRNGVGAIGNSYVVSSGSNANSIPATNNPFLDAASTKGISPFGNSQPVLPMSSSSHLASAGNNPYLTSGSNVGAIVNTYAASSGSNVNSIVPTNNPFLNTVPTKGSFSFGNSQPSLPTSTSSHLTSAGNNPYLTSANNVGAVGNTFAISGDGNVNSVPATNNPFLDAVASQGGSSIGSSYQSPPKNTITGLTSSNNMRMVFPTVATTSRNPFLQTSKATFRLAIKLILGHFLGSYPANYYLCAMQINGSSSFEMEADGARKTSHHM